MQGILLIDKPEGWTSFDVVNYVRKFVARIEGKKPRNIKVGHTGTLDPAATGLLVLCVGKFTKKVPELIKRDKTYEVEVTLGKKSSTGDKEGELTLISEDEPKIDTVKEVLNTFVGEIEQIPPVYSAIKIDGKRAYDLARQGKKIEMKPRKVQICSISEVEYTYPVIDFVTEVSSGTYIRTLAEDIGEKLKTGAYMSNLRRTRVGEYDIGDALKIDELTEVKLQKLLAPQE